MDRVPSLIFLASCVTISFFIGQHYGERNVENKALQSFHRCVTYGTLPGYCLGELYAKVPDLKP